MSGPFELVDGPDDGARRASPRPPTRSHGPLAAILVVAFLGVAAIVVVASTVALREIERNKPTPPPAIKQESAADRQRAIVDAFSGAAGAGSANAAVTQAITTMLETLAAAQARGDGTAAADLIDGRRLYLEMTSRLGSLAPTRKAEDDFVRGMKRGMASALSNREGVMPWTNLRVRRVVATAEAEAEAFCVVSHDINREKVRFFLVRGDDARWRVYD